MGYYHIKWICPYFKSDGKKVIRCEGGRLIFPSARDAKIYARDYCANYKWDRCSIAARLNDYERREYESKGSKEKGCTETKAKGKADSK